MGTVGKILRFQAQSDLRKDSTMKEEYILEISKRLELCNSIQLLDLILKLLKGHSEKEKAA